ncbi:piezo-type mechanosensitive ion channel component 2-like isoform X7 [Phycodurus eques]|uniref:piezo-type mechanosensitive ion channel component 2-like isoform X7 n=1 Tax=Phycodurus eques TaxID=693459 RepID=UPI002ACEA479|nr:piezo-type mechanosensitive ion channel component 2-like isoform X7 [Phycodurus eques]
MSSELLGGFIFRVLLPLSLTAAALLRFNGFSLVYVFLLLLLPLVPEPSRTSLNTGNSSRCVTAVCVSSFLFLLLQTFFQITTATLAPESNCTSWQKALSQLGLVSLIGSDAASAVRHILPDVGVLLVALLTWRLSLRFSPETHAQDSHVFHEEGERTARSRIVAELEELVSKTRTVLANVMTSGGKILLTVLLGLTGVVLPSLSSLPYLLSFQVVCTWWAWSGQAPHLLFRCLSVMSLTYSAAHFLLVYAYQLPPLQEAWLPNHTSASVFGLVPLVSVDCAAPWRMQVNLQLSWFHFVSPLTLIVLYHVIASLRRNQLLDGGGAQSRDKINSLVAGSCEISSDIIATTDEVTGYDVISNDVSSDYDIGNDVISDDVICEVTAQRRRELWSKAHDRRNYRDFLDSSVMDSPSESLALPTQSIALELDTPHYSFSQSGETLETCVFEGDAAGWGEDGEARRGSGVASVALAFLLKQSYIGALMAMMAWSITYVSWLTCVLLLWSCALWMTRQRRRYTLASSPWLVAYGNLLLVLQYIFSFAAVRQVPGLFPKKDDPCRELASKIVCLLTFWLLLRQARTEKGDTQTNPQLSTISVHVDEEERMEEISYEKLLLMKGGVQMDALVAVVTRMFVKYWIYVCGTMFFFVSFEGKLVLYKVIYMVMFLCCVALYQLNYEKWRALLRGFWVAVVVYSMLVLLLVYTFQFPSSLHTWTYYTGLSTHRLEDLGLEKFSVPALFTRIFIPTAFLLVCIVHLHYFHEPFLQLTDLKTVVDTHNSTITRLVHSEGSLVDMSVGGACQLLAEHKTGVALKKEEEAEEKWRHEEEEEKEEEEKTYPCTFEEESLLDPMAVLVSWRLVVDRLSVLFLRLLLSLQRLQRLLWWLLELHMVKIIASYMIWISVKEVCVFNLLFVACVGVALPCRAWRPLLAGVCTVWTCVVAICKMLYQLNIIQPNKSNCSLPGNSTINVSTSVLYAAPIDPAQWVGLRKSEGKLLDYLRYNLMMLALLAFEVTVYRHQELYRLRCNKVPPPTRTLFHDISRRHLDQNVLSCTKYFLNYFFYKFGLEMCFLLAVNVIGQRMDLFAVGHAFGLIGILTRRSRKRISVVWPKYCYFLSALLCFQYLLCIGFPPAACKDYPWRPPTSNMDSNVVKWLFLPDHLTPPNPLFLLYDFLLLLGASLQLQVFEDERDAVVQALAGDNAELDVEDRHVWDPISRLHLSTVPDFMLCRSYLDMMKIIIFSYMFWFVLTIIFITGTTRISIFCMGYLVACFYFLLVGGDLLLKPVSSILVYWDCLIGYNVFVITMKNILSILACGFIKSLVVNHCWLVQLFSLACTIRGYAKPEQQSSKQCELPSDEAGIIWDGVCFCFLLLQRRVFRSHYFLYVVPDLQNTQLLASRGAELFEASTVKAVRARLEVEKMSMDLLKKQMERIKCRQQKFRRGKEKILSLTQKSFHSGAREKTKGRAQGDWWRPWVNHASMVRSGDYFLFESDSQEDEDDKKEEEKEEEDEDHDKSAFQFVYHAWITDSRTAMRARHSQKKGKKQKPKSSSCEQSGREETSACGATEVTDDLEEDAAEPKEEGPDTVLHRASNIIRFCWVLLSALLDSLTTWLCGLCREHVDISTVLRIERCMLTQQAKQGQVPSREAIHVYYQEQMMRTSGELGTDLSAPEEEGRTADLDEKESPGVGSGPALSSGDETEADPSAREDCPECFVATSSQRLRAKLTRMKTVTSSMPSSSDEDDCRAASPSCQVSPLSYSHALGLDIQDQEDEKDDSKKRMRGAGSGLQRQLLLQKPDFLSRCTSTSCLLASRPQELTASELLKNRTFHNVELEASDAFYSNQPQLLQLCYAFYNILAARSETVCYLVIVLNHMVSASCLTLVLPVLVFLWATLSVPRPSKTFWMTAIIYTEDCLHPQVTIVIKYFFQFGFFPFNQKLEVDRSKPFHPPNILGVEKKEGYVLYDLLQLLALFYHRAILKCHGLWDQTVSTDPKHHHDNQAEFSPGCTPTDSARWRDGRQARSSSTHLCSPAGSLSSIEQLGKLDLLLEKLMELSIRSKQYCVSRSKSLYGPVCQFFQALVEPEYSAVTDVYVLMFLADTIDFIIIVFGFWAFGKHSAAADITSSLSEDQVPEAFLVMVLIQFGTMVIDRALYLRKTVLGKLVFQVILVLGIHFWMFFILPTVTERRFNHNLVAQLWYFIKCIYFGLSAYQIRSGYPTRVLGNFLTKSYNYLNLFLFQGFRLVPFLTELRAVMDWVWTDTTLSLSSWICVEDVYAHCFVLKCWRESEKVQSYLKNRSVNLQSPKVFFYSGLQRYPQPRGQKKKRVVKYGMGGLIVLLLICIVWFPLLFMSLIKSVAGVVNQPLDVSLTITLGGFQPIFTMSAQQNQLKDLTEEDFRAFLSSYSYTPGALQFLEAYSHEDVTVAELQGSSNSLWTISPPSRRYLSEVLNLDHFPLTLSWTVQRNLSLGAKAELASGKYVTYLNDQTRLELIQLLNGTRTLPVVIDGVLPSFLRAPSDSNAKPIEQLYADGCYKDILLSLERTPNETQEIQEWWIVDQPASSLVHLGGRASTDNRREAGLQIFVFSDKVSPPSLGFLAGYGIMGLYASVVLVIGKFVREFFSGISHSIMFEELPCVDRILKLCTDIFLVRETGELELEEELYAKLIFLYRSPETLIKWTRR